MLRFATSIAPLHFRTIFKLILTYQVSLSFHKRTKLIPKKDFDVDRKNVLVAEIKKTTRQLTLVQLSIYIKSTPSKAFI